MSTERVERLHRQTARFIAEGLSERFLEDIHPEVRTYPPPEWPGESVYHGPQGVKEFVSEWAENFRDFRWEIDRTIDGGDYVVMLFHQQGLTKDEGVPVRMAFSAVFDDFEGQRPRRSRYFLTWEEALEAVELGE